MSAGTTVHAAMWRPSRLKSLLAACAYPVFLALNRPTMSWFGNLLHDIALRCNGIAITFKGKFGLTQAEENFLRRNNKRFQGGVVLDIGANHGAYTNVLHRLAPTARIFAFEPHPVTFAVLQSAIATSPLITAINQAVADTAGLTELFDFSAEDGSTQASLTASAVSLFSPDIVAHPVDCTTVDQFMAAAKLDHIDLLKIDTEGHDLAVLIGAKTALREHRIKLIQFEFIPANIATGATMHRFFEALHGYRIGRLCLNGTVRWLDRYDVKRCEIYVTHNLIAIPRR